MWAARIAGHTEKNALRGGSQTQMPTRLAGKEAGGCGPREDAGTTQPRPALPCGTPGSASPDLPSSTTNAKNGNPTFTYNLLESL